MPSNENKKSAVYTLIDRGTTTWWYGKNAGDYHSSVGVYQLLQENRIQGGYADMDMGMLTYDPIDRRSVTLNFTSDPYKGEPVFQRAREEDAKTCLKTFQDDIAFHAVLDLDCDRINYSVPGTKTAKPLNFTLRGEDLAAVCERIPLFLEDDNAFFNELLKAGTHWEKVKGKNALYIIVENEKKHYYYSEFGGGHCNPIITFQRLRAARTGMYNLGMRSDIPVLIPAFMARFYNGVKEECAQKPALVPVGKKHAAKLYGGLQMDYDDVGLCVTLDFDEDQIIFVHSPSSQFPDIQVSFDDALASLETANNQVNYCVLPQGYEYSLEQYATNAILKRNLGSASAS